MTARPRSLSRAATVVLTAALAVTLSSCGDSEDPQSTPTPATSSPAEVTATPTPTPTPTEEPEGTVIALDVDAPDAGRREKVSVGETLVLRITAKQAGELHVHSSPEQELEFPAGTTDLTLVVDQPGIVDIEDHATDALLVQLEVS